MRRLLRATSVALICLVIVCSLLLTSLAFMRAMNRHKHKITTPNGINEGVIAEIGGIRQYLHIRGHDKDNPIIVVLHGGPGNTLTPFTYAYQDGLEKDYTIVNWDQRNAGKTYYLNDASQVFETLNIERMVEDLREIVEYLSRRFGQEKVVVMGHSWGSALGTVFVQKYPELVSAYIGVGQVVNSIEGDRLAFETARRAAELTANARDLETFASLRGYLLNDPDFSLNAFVTGRKLVNKYLSPLPDHAVKLALFTPYYTLRDTLYFLKGSFDLQRPLLRWLVDEFDVRNYGTSYQVPVYYILGESDWVTPTVMAQDFFATIEAPQKDLVVIADAGHNTMLDNPGQFCAAVLSALK